MVLQRGLPAADEPGMRGDALTEQLTSQVLALRARTTGLGKHLRRPAPTTSALTRLSHLEPVRVGPLSRVRASQRMLEAQAATSAEPGLILLAVPDRRLALPTELHSLAQLAAGGWAVVVLGPDLPRDCDDPRRPRLVPLRDGDTLAEELVFVVATPRQRMALAAATDRVAAEGPGSAPPRPPAPVAAGPATPVPAVPSRPAPSRSTQILSGHTLSGQTLSGPVLSAPSRTTDNAHAPTTQPGGQPALRYAVSYDAVAVGSCARALLERVPHLHLRLPPLADG